MEIRSGSDYHWVSETAPLIVSQSWPWGSQIASKKITKFPQRGFWNFVWRSSHTFKTDISKIHQLWFKGSQNAIVKIGGWAKLSKLEGSMSSKTVRAPELKLSSFSYYNNKINWWFSSGRLCFLEFKWP